MSNKIELTKEDYLKAEIIALRKENERLKTEVKYESGPPCKSGSCGNKSQMPTGFCYDCHDDYY